MAASILRGKVIEEINRIPEDKLTELYDFIHFFRVGLETGNRKQLAKDVQQILNAIDGIYGLWEDRELNVDEYIRNLRKDRSL